MKFISPDILIAHFNNELSDFIEDFRVLTYLIGSNLIRYLRSPISSTILKHAHTKNPINLKH